MFWGAIAAYNESVTALAIVIAGHVLFLQGHNIEVKLNKLLDHCGLTVSSDDLNR